MAEEWTGDYYRPCYASWIICGMAFDFSNCVEQNILCYFWVYQICLEDCIIFETNLYSLINKKKIVKFIIFCAQKFWCIIFQQLFGIIILHIQFLLFGRLVECAVILTQQMLWYTRNWGKNILMKWKAWASITTDSDCTFLWHCPPCQKLSKYSSGH